MNEIWQRERARREAIWQLDALQPGDHNARPILQRLSELEQLDQEQPLAVCTLDLQQLHELPHEPHAIGFNIIRDADIPQPWLSRFAIAAGPICKVAEGVYRHDWTDFLDAWAKENDHINAHREALE
ncbi:hypothetical protein [Pseudomonas sp. PS01299]|uniref:hypothetical protein n=1 Tax=Pseudomonas sp. PS01299 TaxID=2991435 RepID=UPI00249A2957|nr:hypothetical protein [Pseudomonas sp. PS01299]